MSQRINLSDEAVQLVEALSPLDATVQKIKVGRLWEVPVDTATYNTLLKARRPDESWSEVVMRIVRDAQKLGDFRK